MGRFLITPTGNCNVFRRRRFEAQQQSTGFDAGILPANLPSTSSGSSFPPATISTSLDSLDDNQGHFKRTPGWPSTLMSTETHRDFVRKLVAMNVALEPVTCRHSPSLQGVKSGGSKGGGPRRRKKDIEGLQPWEVDELRYLKLLQKSTSSAEFAAGLLTCYSDPWVPGTSAPVLQDKSGADKYTPEVCSNDTMIRPEVARPSGMNLPRIASSSSVNRRTSSSSTSRVSVPLILPGMKAVPTGNDGLSDEKLQRSPKHSPRSQDQKDQKDQNGGKSRWNHVSPFLKFLTKLTKHRNGQERTGGNHDFSLPKDKSEDNSPRQQENCMHAKTSGMVGSLQQWLNGQSGSKGQDTAMVSLGSAAADTGVDKAEAGLLIQLAKRYGMPVNEVHELRQEFNLRDTSSRGHLTQDEFFALIRKRINLRADEAIPSYLIQGIPEAETRFEKCGIDFEEFLKWSILTSWTEEMMLPSKNDRALRQLAREQEMSLPEVEKVKHLFDEFDTDSSGRIEEDEFRHMVCKMLCVRDVTDLSVKTIQRYWREVDLNRDGVVDFKEFLIWYKNSFLFGRKME